jgi:hypothetical protein
MIEHAMILTFLQYQITDFSNTGDEQGVWGIAAPVTESPNDSI